MDREITGIMVYYNFVCKRKLWYFYNGITMEHTNEDVSIGRSIDEEFYSGEEKHINVKNIINIDYIKDKNIIHEVKKSKVMEEASIEQIKYYLWILHNEGVKDITGVLDYPLLRKSKIIKLELQDFEKIPKILEEIRTLVESEKSPEFKKIKLCKNCAYCDICLI